MLIKDGEVSKWVNHEEMKRLDERNKPLTSPQILRRLYLSFSTNNSLQNFANAQDYAKAKWLGDGPLIPIYMRMMEDLWNDFYQTDEQKRDKVYGDMQATTDNYLMSDLAEFSRAGGAQPFGKNYSFQFLWDSLQRRVTANDQTVAKADRAKARDKDMQEVLEEAKRAKAKANGGNRNNNGPSALPAGLTKNDKKLLTKAKAEQAQNRLEKGGGQQQAATMPVVQPTTEDASKRTRSEKRKASKAAKALAVAEENENALPAKGKGDDKGGKGKGDKGGAGAGKGKGGKQRANSQAPQTDRKCEKVFLDVWSRKGKHAKYGESGMCMWHRIKGTCINGDDCRYSHDPSITLTPEERKLCEEEMSHRYAWNDMKQPTPKGGTPRGTKGGGKPVVVLASDGKEICRAWLRGACHRGEDCNWVHYH